MSTNLANPSNTLAKARWREPYVSEGINRKLNGLVPPGIVRGGRLGTNLAPLCVTIEANDRTGDSVYSYINADGAQVTFRQAGDLTLDLTAVAGTTIYIALYIDYAVLTNTAVYWRAYSHAELFGGAPVPEAPYVVVLGRVVVPGAGVIPAANITPSRRREAWANTSRSLRDWRQVVTDGGFEAAKLSAWTGTAELWFGWDEIQGSNLIGVTGSVTNTQARSGLHSLKLALSGAMPQGVSLRWAGRAKVEEGQLVDASVWFMGDTVAPGPAPGGHLGLLLWFYNDVGGTVIQHYIDDLALVGSFGWTEISEILAVPATATWMDVYINYDDNGAGSTGDYYVDDVRIWVEAGEARDPIDQDDIDQASIRAQSLDVASRPNAGVATLNEFIRLRQGTPVGGLLQLLTGSRDGVGAFGLHLERGAIEVDRVITQLGALMVGTAVNANTARVTTPVPSPAVSHFVLLAHLTQVLGGTAPIRVYGSASSPVLGGETLAITINAAWSHVTGQWSRDVADKSLFFGINDQGFHVFWYPAAAASPWAHAAWRSGAPAGETLLDFYRDPAGKATADLEDAIVRIIRSTAATNPAMGTAPAANSLYAKNVCKAWARFEIVAGAPPTVTVHDSFNVASVAVGGAVVNVTFHTPMANTKYAVTIGDDSLFMASPSCSYMTFAQAVDVLTLHLVDKAAGIVLAPNVVNSGGAIHVFGVQTS